MYDCEEGAEVKYVNSPKTKVKEGAEVKYFNPPLTELTTLIKEEYHLSFFLSNMLNVVKGSCKNVSVLFQPKLADSPKVFLECCKYDLRLVSY